MDVILGLDFGGSASVASYYKDGSLEAVVPHGELDAKTLPSCVAFNQNKKLVVGYEALACRNKKDCFFINRLKEKLVTNEKIVYDNKIIKIQYLISEIFRALKNEAEKELGVSITKTVITTPANFGEEAKYILKDSANLANLEVIRIINEPTAAALYYSHKISSKPQNCLVIDLGSLTLDMTICHISKELIDIEISRGDPSCGHYLVDEELKEKLLNSLLETYPEIQLLVEDPQFNEDLLRLAEKIKVQFSNTNKQSFTVKREVELKDQKYMIHFKITRETLASCYRTYFQKFTQNYKQLLKKSSYTENELDKLILVGGPVNSSLVREMIKEVIDVPVQPYFDNISSVSKGAALYGAILTEKVEQKRILSDVVALSLGVETENNIFEPIIKSGSKIPCSRKAEFTTSEDYQKSVKINILEGERPLSKHCNYLGTIVLEGIESTFKGAPILEIEFSVDLNGILSVSVLDLKTKSKRALTITSRSRLTQEQKAQIKDLAQKNRLKDTTFINNLQLVEKIKTLLVESQDFIRNKPHVNTEIQPFLDELKRLLNNTPIDYESLKAKKQALEDTILRLKCDFYSDSTSIKKL
jgi:molecular chaperone DnaK